MLKIASRAMVAVSRSASSPGALAAQAEHPGLRVSSRTDALRLAVDQQEPRDAIAERLDSTNPGARATSSRRRSASDATRALLAARQCAPCGARHAEQRHVLREPALSSRVGARDAEAVALLAQEGVAAATDPGGSGDCALRREKTQCDEAGHRHRCAFARRRGRRARSGRRRRGARARPRRQQSHCGRRSRRRAVLSVILDLRRERERGTDGPEHVWRRRASASFIAPAKSGLDLPASGELLGSIHRWPAGDLPPPVSSRRRTSARPLAPRRAARSDAGNTRDATPRRDESACRRGRGSRRAHGIGRHRRSTIRSPPGVSTPRSDRPRQRRRSPDSSTPELLGRHGRTTEHGAAYRGEPLAACRASGSAARAATPVDAARERASYSSQVPTMWFAKSPPTQFLEEQSKFV